MITILLGLCVFAVSVLGLAIGLVLRGRGLRGGCHVACTITERCPFPQRAGCAAGEEPTRE